MTIRSFSKFVFATKHLFLLFVFLTYLTPICFFHNTSINNGQLLSRSRFLKEKVTNYGNFFNRTHKYKIKKNSVYNFFFIDSWKKKTIRKNYTLKRLTTCSIFSIFNRKNKKNDIKKNEEKEIKKKKLSVNGIKKANNGNEDNEIDEKEKEKPKIDNSKIEQLIPSNGGAKIEKSLKGVESSNDKNETNLINNKIKKDYDKTKPEKDKENENKKIEMEITRFYDINTNPQKILKNINEYENHLEILKDKTVMAIGTIFCNYNKSLTTDDNFKHFFEKVVATFEEKFKQHSLIKNIVQLQNDKMKNEYLLKNVNYFKEIISILEQYFFNTLLLKTQLLKIKAIDEMKDYMDYGDRKNNTMEYLDKINQVVKKYIKHINKLIPPNYEFSLYKDVQKEHIFVTDFSCHFPTNNYEKLIEQNIKDLKQFTQNIIKNNKLKILKEMENNKNYQNILQIIENQQKQIELLQDQLETSIEGANGKYSPLQCALSYRVPNTNLNVSTQYIKGKVNVKLNCIPDDSMHLLGSYGFVKSLPFGNLGLSLSVNI